VKRGLTFFGGELEKHPAKSRIPPKRQARLAMGETLKKDGKTYGRGEGRRGISLSDRFGKNPDRTIRLPIEILGKRGVGKRRNWMGDEGEGSISRCKKPT